jgi:hypothetical protein
MAKTDISEKIFAYVLSMPDNRFWGLGDCVGRAWHEGKDFKNERK